ncbi:hypothetical protein [Bacillus sp. OTU530]
MMEVLKIIMMNKGVTVFLEELVLQNHFLRSIESGIDLIFMERNSIF